MSPKANQFLADMINAGRYTQYAQTTHQAWLVTKQAQGWRYGQSQDSANKTTPYLVPFVELPAEMRGQNNLTPYVVLNFFRVWAGGRTVYELGIVLAAILEGKKPVLTERLGEYIHSHYVAAQLARGETVQTRTDLVCYEQLDEDTRSWDTELALAVINQLRQDILNYLQQE